MSYKTCPDCGDEFYADEDWKVRCLDCWKQMKQRERKGERPTRIRMSESATVAVLKNEIRTLKRDLECKKRALCLLQDGTQGLETQIKSHLRRLICLVHPDKHGGSETSHNETLWLLGLKEKWGI